MEWVRGEVIGRGSFSTVNIATTSLFDQIAVKSADAADAGLLRHEKHVLDSLGHHQNIVRCLGEDITTENCRRRYNLLLEYAEGGTLADQMKIFNGGKIPEKQVRSYARQMLMGLSHMHKMGFAHLDIKPANLLVSESGEVKIADFGFAERIEGNSRRKGEFRGTPMYMAPESVNYNVYSQSCDVWAVGCSVLELTTGRPAWRRIGDEEHNLVSLLIRIGVGESSPEIPDSVSGELRDFLRSCFVKDPAARWTADMLLRHHFVSDAEEGEIKGGCVPGTWSPRYVSEFPEEWSVSDFVSETRELPASDFEGRLVELLAVDEEFDWAESGSWISVR